MQATEKFFDANWLLYSKIYANNYLYHRDMYPLLIEHLRPKGAGRVLELGCGDAFWTHQLLVATNPSEYTGLDISHTALESARNRLQDLSCLVEVRQGDIMTALPELGQTFDTVLASLSLHHLAAADKQWVFQRIHSLLGAGGRFYLIDIVRRDDETRLDYLARRERHIEAHWQEMTADELDRVRQHWYESDFPETLNALQEMCRAAGFATAQTLYLDPTEAHALVVYQK